EAATAVLLEHVDVREINERVPIRGRPCEPDLAIAVVDADDARGRIDQAVLQLTRTAERPVGTLAQEAVHLRAVDAVLRVVDFDPVAEIPCHANSRSRLIRPS